MQTLVDLSDLLTGEVPPGVYRWPELMEPISVEQSAVLAGWSMRHLASPATTKAEALAAIAQALDFPAYFGGNYDALVDCLSDVAGPTVLLWDNSAALVESDPWAFETICHILAERSTRTPAFAVLVRPSPA